MTDPARPWLSLLTRRAPSPELPPRETPPLLDELRAIEELIRADRPSPSQEASERRLRALALDAADEHHRQQRDRHAFTLTRARRKERQDACARWLQLAVMAAIAGLVVAAAVAGVVEIVTGHVDALRLMIGGR